jgi:tetratricopeptide (TPR) repeat protein
MARMITVLLVLTSLQAYAQSGIADSLFNLKQWSKAAEAYKKNVELKPKDRPAYQYNRMGQSYFFLEQYSKSIDAYKKAVDINGNATIMYNIACAFNKLGKEDSALVWLQKSADAGFTQHEGALNDEDLKSLKDKPAFSEAILKMKKNAKPCAFDAAWHQFDFWIGEWKVYNTLGQQAGTSRIEQILNECVILENWTDASGGTGKSLNLYNPVTGYWQQTWADDKGNVTEFIEGKYEYGAMRFPTSRPQLKNNKNFFRRLTFFKEGEDEVRQLGERTDDEGQTWVTEYDLKYIRVK